MTTGDVVHSLRFSLIKIFPESGFDLGSTSGESSVLTTRLHMQSDMPDSTDLLGVSVNSRIRDRTVTSSIQKFYCRVNSVLYDFKDIPCDVKAKLLDSYCLDVYGSQHLNYSKHDVDIFYSIAEIN